MKHALPGENLLGNPELVQWYIDQQFNIPELITNVLGQPHWARKFESTIDQWIKAGIHLRQIIPSVMKMPEFHHRRDWLELVMADPDYHPLAIKDLLGKSSPANQKFIVEKILELGSDHDLNVLFQYLSNYPHLMDDQQLVASMLERAKSIDIFINYVIARGDFAGNDQIVQWINEYGAISSSRDQALGSFLLPNPSWQERSDFIEGLFNRGNNDSNLIEMLGDKIDYTFSRKHLETFVSRGETDQQLIHIIFSQPRYAQHLDLLSPIIDRLKDLDDYDRKRMSTFLMEKVFTKEHAVDHPELLAKFTDLFMQDDEMIAFNSGQGNSCKKKLEGLVVTGPSPY